MPHGANHAKQIVIDEASALAYELQNGNGADPQTQGKAIGLIVKMITPLYEAELVTVQECAASRDGCSQRLLDKIDTLHTECAVVPPIQNGGAKIKLGPLEISGNPVTSVLLKALGLVPFCVLFYMMAKMLKWF